MVSGESREKHHIHDVPLSADLEVAQRAALGGPGRSVAANILLCLLGGGVIQRLQLLQGILWVRSERRPGGLEREDDQRPCAHLVNQLATVLDGRKGNNGRSDSAESVGEAQIRAEVGPHGQCGEGSSRTSRDADTRTPYRPPAKAGGIREMVRFKVADSSGNTKS